MVFSLAFTAIEVVNSQPAFANSSLAFACKSSSGDLYGYQTQQSSSALNIYRYNVETEVTTALKSYSKLGSSSYSYEGKNAPQAYFNVDKKGTISNTSNVDDIAWLRDGSAWPKYGSTEASFVGYDVERQRVVLGYILSQFGTALNIKVTDHSLSRGNWSRRSNVGAVFAFGGEEVYAVYNGDGEVRKISYNGSNFSFGTSLGNMKKTSKNDGAACHTGTPKQYWEPSASLVGVSSCSGEGKKLQVRLRNPSLVGKNGAGAIHAATYSSTDGQSGTLYSFYSRYWTKRKPIIPVQLLQMDLWLLLITQLQMQMILLR